MTVMNLVTPKAAAKRKLLFNKPASVGSNLHRLFLLVLKLSEDDGIFANNDNFSIKMERTLDDSIVSIMNLLFRKTY